MTVGAKTVPATCFVDILGTHHNPLLTGNKPLRMVCRCATLDTDCQGLGDVLGKRQQLRDRLERLAEVVGRVEPSRAARPDPALADVLFEMGPVVTRWVQEQAGVRWQIIQDFPDYYYPHAPGTVAQGRYLEPELFEGARVLIPRMVRWPSGHCCL